MRIQLGLENEQPVQQSRAGIPIQTIWVESLSPDNARKNLLDINPVEFDTEQSDREHSQHNAAANKARYDTPLSFSNKIEDKKDRVDLDSRREREGHA